MSNKPSSFDELYSALMVLADRREALPAVMSAHDVSRETGLSLDVATRGAATARRMVESLIRDHAERVASGRTPRLEGDITLGLLELVKARVVPGKFPDALLVVYALDPGEIERLHRRIFAQTRERVEAQRKREEELDQYWSSRLNRKRKDIAGKQWRKFEEKRPDGGRPRLCIVFNEPYGFFRLAYWVGLTGQWWFLDSADEIEVTHWCPVPTPPGGWPPE